MGRADTRWRDSKEGQDPEGERDVVNYCTFVPSVSQVPGLLRNVFDKLYLRVPAHTSVLN